MHFKSEKNLPPLPLSLSLRPPASFFLICLIALMVDHRKKSPARGATLACPKAITSLAISSPQLNILPTDIAWLPPPPTSSSHFPPPPPEDNSGKYTHAALRSSPGGRGGNFSETHKLSPAKSSLWLCFEIKKCQFVWLITRSWGATPVQKFIGYLLLIV